MDKIYRILGKRGRITIPCHSFSPSTKSCQASILLLCSSCFESYSKKFYLNSSIQIQKLMLELGAV